MNALKMCHMWIVEIVLYPEQLCSVCRLYKKGFQNANALAIIFHNSIVSVMLEFLDISNDAYSYVAYCESSFFIVLVCFVL